MNWKNILSKYITINAVLGFIVLIMVLCVLLGLDVKLCQYL